MSLPFTLVGILMAVMIMRALSRKETWVDFGYLHYSGRFLLHSWKKKVDLGRIEDVVVEQSGHCGKVFFYRVAVKYTVDLPSFATNQSMRNKKLCIADSFTSKTEATWLKEELLNAVIEKV